MPHHSRLVIKCFHMGKGSIESIMANQCQTCASVDSDKHSGLTVTADQHTALMKIQSSRQADHTLDQIKPNPLTFPSTVTGYHTVPHCPLLQTATESVWCFTKLYDNNKILQNNFRWLYENMIFSQNMLSAIAITGTIPRLLLFSRWAKMPCTLETTWQIQLDYPLIIHQFFRLHDKHY